ncbi:hypothetical protein TorRG33x02_191750 [Trema orientale]|uniref:Uncharacterized protein n=1 Tax=Trema orientale TaxID=63057 RepID=A0A2P5EHQ1_TREOI|nr:hypothetical protein TorRG33x02_191750 [Trema orientale]
MAIKAAINIERVLSLAKNADQQSCPILSDLQIVQNSHQWPTNNPLRRSSMDRHFVSPNLDERPPAPPPLMKEASSVEQNQECSFSNKEYLQTRKVVLLEELTMCLKLFSSSPPPIYGVKTQVKES